MREITWSLKDARNDLLQSFSTTSIYLLDFKSWAHSLIYGHFSNICTEHAHKRLFINFRCKFDTAVRFADPHFVLECKNFCDLATFSVDFCILYAECPPYFYFRFVWPSDLESILHALTPTSIIPTKFEVDMTIRCRVIAFFCLPIRHVTL